MVPCLVYVIPNAPPLARPVVVAEGRFYLGELLEALEKQLGRRLTCADRLSGVSVDGGWQMLPAREALEDIRSQLGPGARWEETEQGWHLYATPPQVAPVSWEVRKVLARARTSAEPLSLFSLENLAHRTSAETLVRSDDAFLRELAPWRALLLQLRRTPGLPRRLERGGVAIEELSEALAPLRTCYPDSEALSLEGALCRLTTEMGAEDSAAGQPILALSLVREGTTLWLVTLPLVPPAASAPAGR
jgi:hypothetical protein